MFRSVMWLLDILRQEHASDEGTEQKVQTPCFVSQNILGWRIEVVYTVANVWQFQHKYAKWSGRLAIGNRDLVS
jgi:hypothetical protein